jgi:glycerol kinase
MNKIPVIAIFDVGKTNKKLFFFDEQYKIVFEQQANFREIQDEDGDPVRPGPTHPLGKKYTRSQL